MLTTGGITTGTTRGGVIIVGIVSRLLSLGILTQVGKMCKRGAEVRLSISQLEIGISVIIGTIDSSTMGRSVLKMSRGAEEVLHIFEPILGW